MRKAEKLICPGRLSRDELASCFRVSSKTITRWRADGLPRSPEGRYCLPDCIAWRIEAEMLTQRAPRPEGDAGELWLTRFRRERALKVRLERRQLAGKLVSLEDIRNEWMKVIMEFRQAALSLPVRLPPILEGKTQDDMRAAIRAAVYAMLTALSRPGKHRPSTRTRKESTK